jgi:dephospho-CoA kinase
MFVAALTGNFGMGKSSVAAMFAECGAFTLDSDAIVANLLQRKGVIEKITAQLGPEILNADHSLNKSVVADIIFHNNAARTKIEALLHPLVFQAIESFIEKIKADSKESRSPLPSHSREEACNISPPLRGGDEGEGGISGHTNDQLSNRIVIVEVPLLFESGFQKRFDRTIAVYTNQKTALSRLKKKGISRKDALARLHAQMDIREKKHLADYVINNNGTRRQTMAQVRKIYGAL